MAGVAIALLVALLFYRLAVHRPGWWVTAGDRSPAAQTRGVATENGVVRELTRVRTAASWGFVLGEEDVNAWLVNRLEPWAESQGRSILPEGISDPRIRFADGWIDLGVIAEQGGADILVLLRIDVVREGEDLRLEASGGGGGPAALITSALIDAITSDLAGSQAEEADAAMRLSSIIPLTDGRRVVLEDFEIVPGELAVQFRTEGP